MTEDTHENRLKYAQCQSHNPSDPTQQCIHNVDHVEGLSQLEQLHYDGAHAWWTDPKAISLRRVLGRGEKLPFDFGTCSLDGSQRIEGEVRLVSLTDDDARLVLVLLKACRLAIADLLTGRG